MNSFVVITIFVIGILLTGTLVYLSRKSIFNIPDLKTKVYEVNIWNNWPNVSGIEKIDDTLLCLAKLVNENFPALSIEAIENKFRILKVYLLNDDDMRLYLRAITVKDPKELSDTTKYKIIDDELYTLRNGVQIGNYIFIRRVGDNLITTTAFVHEVVHYIIESFYIESDGDPRHLNKLYWEDGGWISQIISKFNK